MIRHEKLFGTYRELGIGCQLVQDKCRGSIVGGAVGDALGYEVEFMSLTSIRKRFGTKGIDRYAVHNGVAEFSDDTQMTLFTLEGLMNDAVGKDVLPDTFYGIRQSYLNWYKTQTEAPHPLPDSWIANIKSLWTRRAPGMTCMGALEALSKDIPSRNNSKGCGGVMRVAPVGIFFASHCDMPLPEGRDFYELLVTTASNAAFITHGHTASSYAAALLASIVCRCIMSESPVERANFKHFVTSAMNDCYMHIPLDSCWPEFRDLINMAMKLGGSDVPDTDAIRQLGEGWVGDEAIAIAIFSVMRHIDSFEDCIVCAVNHDGDSDSTGAIAGNIIGAIHGYSSIPGYYLKDLEIEPILVSAADDLCADLKIPEVSHRIYDRYVKHLPVSVDTKYLI